MHQLTNMHGDYFHYVRPTSVEGPITGGKVEKWWNQTC